MPGIASAASSAVVRNNDHHFCNGTPSRNGRVSTTNGFWSKHPEELTYNQLQKFWSELSPQARQKLLRIDKQMVFEQARKNLYCSRCHGLLLEGFLQIVMYGKSLHQEGICNHNTHIRKGDSKNQNDCDLCNTGGSSYDIQDPSVHPWGGLATTRNGMLTLLDCYLYTTSLKSLQNVFDSGRARERERELLYPDACGGDGRGWVSQEMGGYGRVHGTRESCALHTARLSVETLVDFWSALGEETRRSLLRMKEEDFMERLMYRFDSKRFCRDCRKNVIREFKELKELKRIRRENRCTAWFCVADTAFQYQVSLNAIQADWRQTFGDAFSSYEYYEWAVGTGEGKSDILDFENVGLNGRVQVKGLDLSAANSCYITVRGWKMDGRCTELSVKAHALKGKTCVHCRLVVGDGFVSIVRGDNIRRFFEHAEEAEEDEDDESMDKDGNELDGEYSRPQKHAKSPELAREFLLDAATVIFKEQVEKAFREGTARQNAHSIFVCLSLKMLEERVHIACKEIITLEKQTKLLEEEEKEKREEEERKERKRIKEKEKKLRRKERQREKDKNRGLRCNVSNSNQDIDGSDRILSSKVDEDDDDDDDDDLNTNDKGDDDVASETEEAIEFKSLSSDIRDEEELDPTDGSDPNPVDHFNYSQQKFRSKEVDAFSRWPDHRRRFVVSKNGNMISKYEPKKQVNNNHFDSSRTSNGVIKPLKNTRSSYIRNGGPKYSGDQYESRSCSCKPYYARDRDNCGRSRNSCTWDSSSLANKKVWEPLESHKKNNSDYDTNLKSSSALTIEPSESQLFEVKDKCEEKNDDLRDTNTGEHETEVKIVNSTCSNSENCSTCLSEGDSITFSSHSHAQSTEFSSSDSEDTSDNSEGRDSSACLMNNDNNNNTKDGLQMKDSTTGQEHDKGSFGNIKIENKAVQNVSIVSQPQPQVLPQQLHNQTIHLPVFQASPIGYYHHPSPIPWTPFPHPNQYIYATPVGYGVPGNTHFSPYPTLQHHHHLPPPILNHSHMHPPPPPPPPPFQPIIQKEYAMGPNPVVLKSAPPHPEPKKPLPESSKKTTDNKSSDVEKDNFSLFHFGGPLGLPIGFTSDPNTMKKETRTGDDSSSIIKNAANGEEGDEACNNKNTSIEEYNLFTSSNGINFSFF